MIRLFCILLACLLTLTACPMNTKAKDVLPRNMALKAFDPHRTSFECKHEAKAVPPTDPEADAWFHEGMRLTSMDLWPNQRDYPKAVALWTKAAERKHWKAMMNLAGVLSQGDGTQPYAVPPNTELAVLIVEEGMRLGIPAAFDMMGTFHQSALGVNGDISRAYAFWELAADKGSPRAQAFLGDKLNATYDNPKEGFWGNRKIALQMLECSFAQGHGQGAYELGSYLSNSAKDYSRALSVLHEGVKMGCEDCANSMSVLFSGAEMMEGGPAADPAREKRYSLLGDALYQNPDRRFPNLDKVLPLPPARLPAWDGKKESLLKAAMAVVPTPPPPSPPKPVANPASKLTGKAQIPEGWMLPEHPAIKVEDQHETTRASEAGYWVARLLHPHTDEQHAWNAAQLPLQYAQGELFDRTRPGLRDEDGRIVFRYVGQPVPAPAPEQSPIAYEHPLAARGIARYGDLPEPAFLCKGNGPCRKTGVWEARVIDDHALAAVFNQWHRQAYVQESQPFPDPQALHLDIAAREVTWRWLAQANTGDPSGFMSIHVDEPSAFATVDVPEPLARLEAEADTSTDVAAAPLDSPAPAPAQEQAAAKSKPGLLGRLWPPRG